MFAEVPGLQALLRVQLLLQSYYVSGAHSPFLHKGPSAFHHSSGKKHEFVESDICSYASYFLEDARSSPQLWEANWTWALVFMQIFNVQLSCTGFHAPNYDWYCCTRAGWRENLPPSHIHWTPFSLKVVCIKLLLKTPCNFSMSCMLLQPQFFTEIPRLSECLRGNFWLFRHHIHIVLKQFIFH